MDMEVHVEPCRSDLGDGFRGMVFDPATQRVHFITKQLPFADRARTRAQRWIDDHRDQPGLRQIAS